MKLLTTVFFLLLTQVNFAQDSAQRIDSLIRGLASEGKFNGNILVAEQGKISYLKSIGFANETTKEELDEHSVFDLASVSKQFTAMGIMILKEQDKLALEDKIAHYLPELSCYPEITIKNLLHHTSGLPDYLRKLQPIVDRTKKITNKDIIKLYGKHQFPLYFESGTKYKYSNTGYAFLASIIEQISGSTYREFLDKMIFKPLQMTRTFVNPSLSELEKIDNYAYGYLYDRNHKKYVLPNKIERARKMFGWVNVVGDGAIHATVLDLLKWDRALYTNTLVSQKSINEMFTPSYNNDKILKSYGYGWSIKENILAGKFVRHSGGWPGYITEIERHITSDKTIIVLQNHYDVEKSPAKAIRNIVYGKDAPKKMIELYNEGKSVIEILSLCQDPNTAYRVDGFWEDEINQFGYQLLEKEKIQEALSVFKLNVELYPESANVYDSLGECFIKLGKKYYKEGIQAYEQSLALNPNNKNAASVIAELKK
ncbi:serine hydrolase [Aquimarina sp. 2201CG1-2-11]|uniref:serine hydrolase n=1 Tax=Aquimarina discodermiae TaxID=3231043 RepID=UPI00346347B2